MEIVMREDCWLVSFVQSGETSPWGYLKGRHWVFAPSNQCPALLDESLGGGKTKDIGVILHPESTLLQQ